MGTVPRRARGPEVTHKEPTPVQVVSRATRKLLACPTRSHPYMTRHLRGALAFPPPGSGVRPPLVGYLTFGLATATSLTPN